MQWITINCIDFPNIKFHSSNPWLHNVYVLPLSKRINAVENTCLKNQNKSSCIYKYVPIHLCAWNIMMSLRNANQYRSFCIISFFHFICLMSNGKICVSNKWYKQTYHINQICSNISTDHIWFITSYRMTLWGTKACSQRCFFPSKSSVFPFYLM